MGYGPLAHFKGPSSFWARINPDVLMSISAAYVTIGTYISRVSTNYTFSIVYKGRHTKEMSVIDEPAHVAVRLQLLEMSSITTPNQTISNICTRYNILRALF